MLNRFFIQRRRTPNSVNAGCHQGSYVSDEDTSWQPGEFERRRQNEGRSGCRFRSSVWDLSLLEGGLWVFCKKNFTRYKI